MFAFLGKLMGIAMRSKEYLALNLPSLVWKLIAGDTPGVDDLEAVDVSLVRSLQTLRRIDQQGITDSAGFSAAFFETFTLTTTDDRLMELVPGGASRDLTFDNRLEYCDLVTQYRLHEFDVQAEAIRKGLATIVPLHLLVISC